MDFYETSACTNLNIKEVSTLGTAALTGAEPRRGGGWEEMADRSQDKTGDPFRRGQLQGDPKQRRGQWTNLYPSPSQSFTRLTELVLQAHRKELDGLRTRASHELALAELEEEEGKPEGPANSSKTCWC